MRAKPFPPGRIRSEVACSRSLENDLTGAGGSSASTRALRSATSRSRSEKEKGSSSKKEEEAERRAEATMLDARCLLLEFNLRYADTDQGLIAIRTGDVNTALAVDSVNQPACDFAVVNVPVATVVVEPIVRHIDILAA